MQSRDRHGGSDGEERAFAHIYPDDPVAIFDGVRTGQAQRVPKRFWQDPEICREVVCHVLTREGWTLDDAPGVGRSRWFHERRLGTLLRGYRGSPSWLFQSLWPGRWTLGDFPEAPKAAEFQTAAFESPGVEAA